MTNRFTKYGLMIIAAVLLVGLAFAGAAGASTGISITNASGLYGLHNAGDIVNGDLGSVTLISNGTDTDGLWIIELDNFNVNIEVGSIINANVANLEIRLKGDSNLTASYCAYQSGMIYSSGNLTITTVDNGKLLVNNTETGSNGYAIYVENDITITNGTVIATENSDEAVAIVARFGNLTIHDGTVNATANHGHANAISVPNGNVIINGGTVNVIAGSTAISAGKDVIITDGTITASGSYGSAIYTEEGNVAINNGTVTATGTNSWTNAISTNHGDITINGGTVNATATGKNAIYTEEGNVTIIGGTVNATATGTNGYAIYAKNELTIEDGTVTATASGSSGSAIYAESGNVTINDGTITAISDYTVISAENNIVIKNGTVNATATGEWTYAISTTQGDITINSGTVNITAIYYAISAGNDVTITNGTVTATATGNDGAAIYADNDLTITSVDQLIANGTNVAFEYYGQRTFLLGNDYEYWVNQTNPTLPLVNLNYTQFNASENWTGEYSVYTNVLIKPITYTVTFAMQGHGTQIADQEVRKGNCATEPTKPTASGYTFGGWFKEPACTNAWNFNTVVTNDTTLYAKWTPKQSSNKDMGSTVILTETVTPTPVPTATPTATAVPTIATVNPTTQQTQKSPAPVFGIIAGLGAAAVLLRLRK